ncbi:MAG: MFS transporter, partial [Comamonadaceae bacterium]
MLMWKYLRANPQAALLLGIVLIAASLRAPFTVVPALLGPIGREFGLNSVGTGALTTLPLIAFALISSFGGQISGRLGLERALAIALAAIIAGIGLRSFGSVSNLFVGTAIIGVGVAIGNVLLPSLVKRDFPLHIASLTGAYVLAMNICAGLGSAAVV